jgi:hypothetical protein
MRAQIDGRGVYIASKTRHAHKWVALHDSGAPIISTWIDEAGEGQTASFADLWTRCVYEAANSRMLILYSENQESLKGALIEMGAALACGIPVVIVGDAPQLKTAKHHPLVSHAATVEEALSRLEKL